MSSSVPLRIALAAWCYVAVVVLVVAAVWLPAYPAWITGVIAWTACLLLLPRLPRHQLIMVLVLAGLGVIGITWGMAHGGSGLIAMALTQNVPLAGMLIAVSFLRLIAVDRGTASGPLQQGRGALLKTMIGVHLFGAVINFSAVAIFADRLSARTRLTMEQAMGLSQAFIVGATWSPFYGAMAAALTAAPGASLAQLIAWGLPIAAIGIAVTWFTLTSVRHGGARTFVGYPLHLEALWVPAVLAAGVLAVHEWQPRWSVLAIIAALAPLVTILTLLVRDGRKTGLVLLRLVHLGLPGMNGELTLFLAAGILSAGMSGTIDALALGMPFAQFGAFEASLTLIVMNVCAWLGLHPIILVSVLGPWLTPLQPDQTLLAMTFLMSWGIGLTACPMSNTMLAMAGRYGLPFGELLGQNRRYSIKMTAVGIAVLYLYGVVKGI
ncbi:MAG: hypothetical protein Q8L95_03540 [Burkholderiales bacterium]|nr:hypothetical protein [Burkholderiales bacterium]